RCWCPMPASANLKDRPVLGPRFRAIERRTFVWKFCMTGSMYFVLVRRGCLAAALWLVTMVPAWAALPIQHCTHASGARVYLIESPVIPMLDVEINVDGGSRRDPAKQTGLASVTAAMLSVGVAKQGDQPALDENPLSEAWLDLGAQFGAGASEDRFAL